MKKILFILAIATIGVACEKEHEHKNLCPVVSEKAIPTSVSSAFQGKYPNVIVEKWFNKDNKGYCALFNLNGKETKVLFDNIGNFQKEEMDQKGQHEDDDDNGCQCHTDKD
ncbi:MAG: hypothetical protein ABIX01_09765 [Chitinophagaceae bacterium]